MNAGDTWKGIVFGAVGGAVGTFLMSYYWKAARAFHGHDPRMLIHLGPPNAMDDISIAGLLAESDEASTEAAGRIVHEKMIGRPPSEARKTQLSEGVHWSYGIAVSAAYGALRGRRPIPDLAGGAAFGTALWAIGDELMVPLLGLSKGPTAYPVEQHIHRWGVHLFYGAASAATTQALFRVFSPTPPRREIVMDALKAYVTVRGVKTAARAASVLFGKRSRGMKRIVRSTRKTTRNVVDGAPRKTFRMLSRTGRQAGHSIRHFLN